MKKQRIKPGSIIKVQFDEHFHTYGRILIRPYIEFYDYKINSDILDLEIIISQPILFTLCVYDYAITKGRWQIIGEMPFIEADINIPLQFLQDPIDLNRCRVIDAFGNISPATINQCEHLEPSDVWEPEHVEERLQDYYQGKPNKWVESLKLKNPIV